MFYAISLWAILYFNVEFNYLYLVTNIKYENNRQTQHTHARTEIDRWTLATLKYYQRLTNYKADRRPHKRP